MDKIKDKILDRIREFRPRYHRGEFFTYFGLGKYRVYFTTHTLRRKPKTSGKNSWKQRAREQKLIEQGAVCPMCGMQLADRISSLHHIKPVSIYPELSRDINNVVLLCHACHTKLHRQSIHEANIELSKKTFN